MNPGEQSLHQQKSIPQSANHRERRVLLYGSTGKMDKEYPPFDWVEGAVTSGARGGTAKISQVSEIFAMVDDPNFEMTSL